MKKESLISLISALLLTICGGFCDVYTFITRGGVFANMQTGNLIKFFISLINNHNFELMFILPILFFFFGCLLAALLQKWKYQYILTLVLLIASFLWCGFCPQTYEWNLVCVCVLSVTGAMQFQAFRHCVDFYYTSTMCTNNMRLLSKSIVEKNKEKILFYLVVILTFAFGCALGVMITKVMGIYSLCPFSAIYSLVLISEIITKSKKEELESHPA